MAEEMDNEKPGQLSEKTGEQPASEKAEEQVEKSEQELLREKVSELEQQAAQLKDQLLRKAAEFENYKRRTEGDFLALSKFAGENIIGQILPVVDDFTRFLKNGKEKFDSDPFYKGIELIYSKLLKILEAQGLKAMEVEGKEFNVDFHDALLQLPRSDMPPHIILEEVEKGYFLHDKVLRHAKVVVSTSLAENGENARNRTEELKK